MVAIKTCNFSLAEMGQIDFSLSYVDLDSSFKINQNETHIHNECEIYLNLSGDVSFEVENRIYPVSRGSVIITRPYEFHHCIYHSDKCHKHYWITFSAKQEENFLKMFFDRKKGSDNLIILNEEQLNKAVKILDELLKKDTDLLLRRINFLELMHILNIAKRSTYVENMESLPDDVVGALKYMDDHLTDEITVNELAAACNVSPSTLERRFKGNFGCSVFAMFRKKRLAVSMKYLRDGDRVSEAAYKSGFSDYSNYIHLFRKQFGLTPLQYKKKFEKE